MDRDQSQMINTFRHIISVVGNKKKKYVLLKNDTIKTNYNKQKNTIFVNRKDTLRYEKLKEIYQK